MHAVYLKCMIRSLQIVHFMSALLTWIKDQIMILYLALMCNSQAARQFYRITVVLNMCKCQVYIELYSTHDVSRSLKKF